MPDLTGRQLGNYRLSKRIGEGGSAEVYIGEHLQQHAQAAIKIFKTTLEQEGLEQFRFEAGSIARLAHPNLVRVFDFGLDGQTPYLVMDYAAQGTLRQIYPRGRRLELPTVVRYVKQVAEALQYVHDRQIVHREVRPENMLAGPQQNILLSDLGMAIISAKPRSINMQTVPSAIYYMAPEHLQGQARPASDQYSLAIVAYEWLAGAPPFTGANYQEVAGQQQNQTPRRLHELVPDLPPDVERVIMRALEKDSRARFNSIKEFAGALEQATTSTFVRQPSSPHGEPALAPGSFTPQPTPFRSAISPTVPASPGLPGQSPSTPVALGSTAMEDAQRSWPTTEPPGPVSEPVRGSQVPPTIPAQPFSGSAWTAPPPPAESFGSFGSTPASGPYADLPGPSIQYPVYAPTPMPAPAYGYAPMQPMAAMPVYVPPPKKPIYFPLTRKAPVILQIFGILLYSLLMAISIMGIVLYFMNPYRPGSNPFVNPDNSANGLAILLMIVLGLLVVPACSMLCGALFGSWRGLLASLLSIGGGIFITHATNAEFWSAPTLSSYLLLAPLPLTALVVGLIYDRRKYAAWWKSMFTMMLGSAIVCIWLVALIMIEGVNSPNFTTSTSSSFVSPQSVIASLWIVGGCLSIVLILVMTFPIAIIEGIIHGRVVAAKKK